jgi:hypothetical protein
MQLTSDASPAPAFLKVQRIALILLMLLAMAVSLDHVRRWFTGLPPDLRAFYAAGQLVDRHASPYTVEPLLTRERALTGPHATQQIVAPVPLPPYDLVAFGLLARLPVRAAAACMGFLTIGAAFAIAAATYRPARLPFPLAAAIAFEAVVYSASGLGQIAPIAIALLALALWALRAGHERTAGLAVAASMIQPQIAIGALMSTLLFVPKARLSALATMCIAALASYLMLPKSVIMEYAGVLKIHALAELHFPAQYSLTWLAARFGVPPESALWAGALSSLFFLLTSLIIVACASRTARTNGAVIAVPAAFAVLGGSFLHEHQLALALLPALLYSRPTRSLFDSLWALAVLLIPFTSFLTLEPFWPNPPAYPSIVVAFATAAALVYQRGLPLGPVLALRKASVVTAGLLVLFLIFMKARPIVHIVLPNIPVIPGENASLAWNVFCESANAAFHSAWYPLLVKVPIWLSASVIALCAARNVETPACT